MRTVIVLADRYIATTTLAIIAVFLEYLGQFLIDLHEIYRHSSVPKTRLPVIFELLSSSGFRARRRRDFFLSGCACHGVGNPSTASHHRKLAKLTCSQLLSMPDVEKSQHFYRGRSQN